LTPTVTPVTNLMSYPVPHQLPTLNELCRLAFNDPVQWLAGDPDQVGQVQWVTSTPEEVQEDDVLLVDGQRQDLAALIDNIGRKGGAALLLVSPKPGRLPQMSGELPVGAIPEAGKLPVILRKLLTIVINHRVALMERGVQVHAHLSQLAAEGNGLVGIAQAMGEITGRGILIQDKRLQIQAQYPSRSLLAYWDEILNHLTQLSSLPEILRDRKQAGKFPNVFTQDIPGGLRRLVSPIIVSEVARGYLSLVGMAGELDALDQLVAEQGALVCAVEMARTKAVRETEKRLKGNLLTALLQDELSPRDALLWVQEMGINPDHTYVAIRFAWEGTPTPSLRRMETKINGAVARLGLKTLISPMEQEIICFCPHDPTRHNAEAALELGKAALARETSDSAGVRLLCGIGAPASDLSEWRRSFRQAGQALEMARRLGTEEPLYFPDLSVYRLLTQIEFNPELEIFRKEILGPLLEYEGGPELVHTLEAYFEHNGNLSQTAESLFIHRNTLIYRMERISEILEIDFDRPETRLAVQLALHVNRMLGSP
jgi:purine catabolism regulator